MLLLGFIALILLVPALLWLSAWAGLDRTRAHSRATRALPRFDEGAGSGLVRIEAGGFEFRARVAGFEGDGPGLILLHGFPETSIMWEPLIVRAADMGFRVVAFDQRGYSPGARPRGTEAYHVERLVEDLHAVADAVGFDTFHLIGHDWGSIVGWAASAGDPDRILSWASLSIPHPAAIAPPDVSPKTPTYIRVFRVPGLAETLLGFGDRLVLRRVIWQGMSSAHRDEYAAVFSEPGALTAALDWYRAMDLTGSTGAGIGPVSQPVLYIYGRNDIAAFVNPEVQARLPDHVSGPLESIALDAGHWLMEEETRVVLDALSGHLERARKAAVLRGRPGE